MRLSAEAWRLREHARAALASGDFGRVSELAAQAQQMEKTPAGGALVMVAKWPGAV
jgi:hypothetical protein